MNKECNLTLEDKCGYHGASRNQRKNEIERGLGEDGTKSFEDMGCYKCGGNDRSCDAYFNPKEEYERGFNNE